MTANEELACNARKVAKCLCFNPQLEMSALIAVFYKLAGVSMDCATLNANAAQFACLPRQAQLPALIYLANLIVTSQIAPAGSGFVFGGIGSPVGVIFPVAPAAVYFDNTIPASPNMWSWNGSSWTEIIG